MIEVELLYGDEFVGQTVQLTRVPVTGETILVDTDDGIALFTVEHVTHTATSGASVAAEIRGRWSRDLL